MFSPFILAALIAFAAISVNVILDKRIPGDSDPDRKKQAMFFPLIIMAAQWLLFILLIVLHHFCMAESDFRLPASAIILFSLSLQAAVCVPVKFPRIQRLGKMLAILGAGLFIFEIAVCNAKSFTLDQQSMYISPSNFTFAKDSGIRYEGNSIVITKNADVLAEDLPAWTRAVSLELEQEEKKLPFKVCICIEDENFSTAPQMVGAKLTSAYGENVNFSIRPYKELHSLQMSFSEMTGPVTLHSVEVMTAIPFSFSALRYFALFFLIGVVLLIREFRLAHIVYQHKNDKHRYAVLAMTALCVMSSLLFIIPDRPLLSYPEDFNTADADPYSQTLDAFEHGQPWLHVDVDPNIESVPNIYDRFVREESGCGYLWDRAYYDGKFYSYFGIAPVLTFYYPVYWITGSLPTVYHTCLFFSSLAIVFLCLAIVSMVRYFTKNPNLLLLLLSLPTATALSGPYYCMQYPNIYNVVVASGLCFLFLALWLGFQACLTAKHSSRMVQLVLCGIACVLCVASRPGMALGALLLTPAFLGILLEKQKPLKSRLQQASGFLIPVLIGAAGLMYYNFIRFGSPTEFGARFQLTISNINANHIRLSMMPAAFYHYFLQFPHIKHVFPFFTFSRHVFDNYQMYNYQENCMGILMFPMVSLGMLLLPRILRQRRNIGSAAGNLQTKAFLICCFGLAVIIAWMDLCLGGVSIRYMMDFAGILLLGSVIAMLTVATHPARYTYTISIGAVLLSYVMIWLLMLNISTEGNATTTLVCQYPTLHEILEDLIIFWD